LYETHEQNKKSFEDFRKETRRGLPRETFEKNLQLNLLEKSNEMIGSAGGLTVINGGE
jgi:hypothetical protein